MKNSFRENIIIARAVAVTLLAVLLTACIKNDVPYPRIPQNITAIAAEGEISPAAIDTANFTVMLYLGEDVDITKVKFTEFAVTPDAEISENLLDGTWDLSDPITLNVSRYQTYQWIIEATQEIERYFNIEGQIGTSIIDVPGKRVVVTVPDFMDVAHLKVTDVKLGAAGVSAMNPSITPGYYDFSTPMRVKVTTFGRTEDWTIFVIKSEVLVSTTSVDAWSQVIWAYGTAPADADNGFEYRLATESEWHRVPDSYVTHNGGDFNCHIPHLTPLETYVVRAVSDDEKGNEITVTTEGTQLIPDGSFDDWWLNNKIWCPWSKDGEQFWDTGNTGAATLGQSNVTPSDDTPDGQGKSAMLATRFVGIGSIGRLAAGSIYSGRYVRTDGANGVLAFGRPWTLRPTKLRGYMKFTTAPINYASNEWKSLMGRPDSCHIYVALTDWEQPYEIRTNPNDRQLFDKNSPAIIAYGELIRGSDTNGWVEFEIKLNYRSTSRKPRYLQITSAASKYGDYFTGGTGTVLYVDQYSFDYDY